VIRDITLANNEEFTVTELLICVNKKVIRSSNGVQSHFGIAEKEVFSSVFHRPSCSKMEPAPLLFLRRRKKPQLHRLSLDHGARVNIQKKFRVLFTELAG